MGKFIDLTGMKYGKLTVLMSGKTRVMSNGNHVRTWICRCDCGKVKEIIAYSLTSGHTKSCGCLKAERLLEKPIYHVKTGDSNYKNRIYRIYKAMKNRCYNQNEKYFYLYGRRGIIVCDEWLGENGFKNFQRWALENGYSEELTIDRIDTNGNYEPSNCQWSTIRQQANNKRLSIRIMYQGSIRPISEVADEIGCSYQKVYNNTEHFLEYGE